MYVIGVYDIAQKRVGKMHKLFKQYLIWIQNSVFEGEITKGSLMELKMRAKKIMDEDDSLIFFHSRDSKWLNKEIIGKERNSTDNFI